MKPIAALEAAGSVEPPRFVRRPEDVALQYGAVALRQIGVDEALLAPPLQVDPGADQRRHGFRVSRFHFAAPRDVCPPARLSGLPRRLCGDGPKRSVVGSRRKPSRPPPKLGQCGFGSSSASGKSGCATSMAGKPSRGRSNRCPPMPLDRPARSASLWRGARHENPGQDRSDGCAWVHRSACPRASPIPDLTDGIGNRPMA